jgi:hypothetical protein
MSEHPAEELLEQFALRRLPAESLMEILRHLDRCADCRRRLQTEQVFIDTIRAVLQAGLD